MTVLTSRWLTPAVIFIGCFVLLCITLAPTIYYLVDSSEFAIGAATLGIVHAPGYPLYLSIAHVFTWLSVGDVAYRVNLFSAFSLALTAPFYLAILNHLIRDRWLAISVTLIVLWSHYVWLVGVAAEVYAPQLLTVSIAGWALIRLQVSPVTNRAVLAGALYGLAVAMNPTSVFLAPGFIVAFRISGVSWRDSIFAAFAGMIVFLASLLYFPLRYSTQPIFNAAGYYLADGSFSPIALDTLSGIWWLIRGAQFDNLFFAEGVIPSLEQIRATLILFWGNFLGIGLIVGIIGGLIVWRTSRRLFLVWLVFFVPFTYFYTTYGAVDRDTMFGPAHLLWGILLAFGLRWFIEQAPKVWKIVILTALPLFMLVINLPIVSAAHITSVREHAEDVIQHLPENAVVFGSWLDVIALQYLQIVENERPDLRLYNLYYFEDQDFNIYVASLVEAQNIPIIFLSERMGSQRKTNFVQLFYTLEPIPSPATSEVIGYQLAGVASSE